MTQPPIKLGIPLYPTFDSLDVLGPYQVFFYAPNIELHLIAETTDPVTSLEGVRITADGTFAACPKLDVLFVPGASDLVSPLHADSHGHHPLLEFLSDQGQRAQLVCSVCTGALLLAAAHLLDGHTATTHWTQLQTLALFPITVAPGFPRYVKSGNRITGGGISSGIDEALFIVSLLCGDESAMECQLKMQYRPEPQFHAGDPADGDIWKHPDMPAKIESDWHSADVRNAYKAWLETQAS